MYLEQEKLRAIVNNGDFTYYVSTCHTYDRGYETMVFLSKYQPDTNYSYEIDFELINFSDIHQELHETWEEAKRYHKIIIEYIKDFDGQGQALNAGPTSVTVNELLLLLEQLEK